MLIILLLQNGKQGESKSLATENAAAMAEGAEKSS